MALDILLGGRHYKVAHKVPHGIVGGGALLKAEGARSIGGACGKAVAHSRLAAPDLVQLARERIVGAAIVVGHVDKLMNEAHISSYLACLRLLAVLVQQAESALRQALANDLCALKHVAARPGGKAFTLAAGTVGGEYITLVARNGTLGTHDVGRNIAQIGGAKGAHKFTLAGHLIGIVLLLQQQRSVTHIVAGHQLIGVVHRGGVHGIPVEGAQQIVLLVHKAQLRQRLVHIVLILGTLLLRIAQIRCRRAIDVHIEQHSLREIDATIYQVIRGAFDALQSQHKIKKSILFNRGIGHLPSRVLGPSPQRFAAQSPEWKYHRASASRSRQVLHACGCH